MTIFYENDFPYSRNKKGELIILPEILPEISENDAVFLASFGDSDCGYVARGECAEMYGIYAIDLDVLILRIIYQDEVDRLNQIDRKGQDRGRPIESD